MPDPSTATAPPLSRTPVSQRLRPWADVLHRLLTAIAAALAIWKAMG